MTGWAICVTGILVIGSLADVASYSFFELIGAESLAESKLAVTGAGAGADRRDDHGLRARHRALGPPAEGADGAPDRRRCCCSPRSRIYKVFSGDAPPAAVDPSLSWFNPFAIASGGALTGALLLGVFIYWGWESAVNLNEETEGRSTAPGLAGLISTVLLLVTYLGVATALIAWKGEAGAAAFDDNEAILASYASGVLGGPLDRPGPAGGGGLRPRLDPDDDPAGLPHLALDGAGGGDAERPRRGQRALFHPGRLDRGNRGAGCHLVPALKAGQRKLPLRLALRPGPDDRLLLRASPGSPAPSTTGASCANR